MTHQLRRGIVLALLLLPATSAVAFAGSVHVGAVKSGKYAGAVRDTPITINVASNGKSAKVSVVFPPAYCQGGSGGAVQHSRPAAISKGAMTAKITYTVEGSNRQFATLTIKGTFFNKVFEGVAKSSFTPAVSCNGQSSFEATTAKPAVPGA